MNYYDEIKNYVKKVEIGRAIREANANYELVDSYWNIGKLIVDAQGGKEKSKYGDKLLKEWSEKLTHEYGKGYDYSNLKRFRQFYLTFCKLRRSAPQIKLDKYLQNTTNQR